MTQEAMYRIASETLRREPETRVLGKFVYEGNAIPWLSCVAIVDMANLNQWDGGVCVCVLNPSTLCSLMECSTPCSSVHGIFLAKMLEWGAISYSRGSSWPRNQTHVSGISCIGRQIFLQLAPPGKPSDEAVSQIIGSFSSETQSETRNLIWGVSKQKADHWNLLELLRWMREGETKKLPRSERAEVCEMVMFRRVKVKSADNRGVCAIGAKQQNSVSQ